MPISFSTLACIDALAPQAVSGAQASARVIWVEEGDTSSFSSFLLVQKQNSERYISTLRADDGSLISNSDDLCEAFVLFTVISLPLYRIIPLLVMSCCPRFLRLCLLISFLLAKAFSDGRNLGESFRGWLMERLLVVMAFLWNFFYVKFWLVLGGDLVDVLNCCFTSGTMSPSQRRGVISLIFKKGDYLDPKNWRPIILSLET